MWAYCNTLNTGTFSLLDMSVLSLYFHAFKGGVMLLNLAELGITPELLHRTSSVRVEEYGTRRTPILREADGWCIAFAHVLCLSWKSGGSMSWPQRDWSGAVAHGDTAVTLTLTRVGHGTDWTDSDYPSPPKSAAKYVIRFTLRPAQT